MRLRATGRSLVFGFPGVNVFDASAEEAARIMIGDPGVKIRVFNCQVHPDRGLMGDRLPA